MLTSRFIAFWALILTFPSVALARQVTPRGELDSEEKANINLFKASTNSVVYITNLAVRRDPFNFNVMEVPQGTGSGFVWDKQGHIITNRHVVTGAQAAQVTLSDNSKWSAKLVGLEADKDIAVLKIEAPARLLSPIVVGASDNLSVGQNVFAIGNPFGLDQTLTKGIISALGREIMSPSGRPISGVIQTDAVINPGNSGGPLLDSSGRLIGMNTAIYSPTGSSVGIGFAVPVDVINRIVEILIRHGEVKKAILGINFASDNQAKSLNIKGVLVLDVVPGSGAERAGIKGTIRDFVGRVEVGDVITAIDGKDVKNISDMFRLLDDKNAGDTVRLQVKRESKTITVPVTLTAVER